MHGAVVLAILHRVNFTASDEYHHVLYKIAVLFTGGLFREVCTGHCWLKSHVHSESESNTLATQDQVVILRKSLC